MEKNLYLLPRVLKIAHTIEPTWAKDAGRNSNSGKFSGTFVGWFDTIKVNVGRTNQRELTAIRNEIEKPIIENVIFTDSKTGKEKKADFYGTAITGETDNIRGVYKPFSFSLKAVEGRSDM